MPVRPALEELQNLRRGLRKRKLPHVFHEMWCSQPGIGGAKFIANGNDFDVEWVVVEAGKKSALKHASFQQLCADPNFELLRLELGWVVADICQVDAQAVMDSIGHPTEAWKAAAPQRKVAESWRHWALVPAGYMTF